MGDMGASILAKLKNKAKTSKISNQQYQVLFCEEEFLRRLALSKYTDKFVLKGGLLICHLTNFVSRPTIDMDFTLRNISGNKEYIQVVIEEILAVSTEYSGEVQLEINRIKGITSIREYPGISVHIIGHIKNTRVPFDIDMGIGDAIIPSPVKMPIRTQFDNTNAPQITASSIESVVAEKFDAILQRMELTSRMKDFYDVAYLSKMFDFTGATLCQAIEQTLITRKTPYDVMSLSNVLALVNNKEINNHWRNFINDFPDTRLPFSDVMTQIKTFLNPVWSAITNQTAMTLNWSHINVCWL